MGVESPQFDPKFQRKVGAKVLFGDDHASIAWKIHDRLGTGGIRGDDDLDYKVAGYLHTYKSCQEIGEMFGVTPEEVAFREGKLFERLRNIELQEQKKSRSLKDRILRRIR